MTLFFVVPEGKIWLLQHNLKLFKPINIRFHAVSGQNIVGIYIIPLVLIQHADSKQTTVYNN